MCWTGWILSLAIFGMCCSNLLGQGPSNQPSFRVDTDIYMADDKKPSLQTLTLFQEGVYYDFAVQEMGPISVFDITRNRILLLDRQRKVRTTVNSNELLELVTKAKIEAASQPELKSVLAASTMLRHDQATKEVIVGNDEISYRATTQQPDDPRMAAQYADFADWSSRLNAVYPPYLQPFVRMSLNRELARMQMLPQEVIKVWKHNGETAEARIRLLPNGRLSTDDQSRIAQVGAMLAQFKEVPIEAYMQVSIPKSAAANGSSNR